MCLRANLVGAPLCTCVMYHVTGTLLFVRPSCLVNNAYQYSTVYSVERSEVEHRHDSGLMNIVAKWSFVRVSCSCSFGAACSWFGYTFTPHVVASTKSCRAALSVGAYVMHRYTLQTHVNQRACVLRFFCVLVYDAGPFLETILLSCR